MVSESPTCCNTRILQVVVNVVALCGLTRFVFLAQRLLSMSACSKMQLSNIL